MLRLFVYKGMNMVNRDDGAGNQPVFVKRNIAERVKKPLWRDIAAHKFSAFFIILHHFTGGLVRNVEITAVKYAVRFELGNQCRQKLLQKSQIFYAMSIGLPTKDSFIFTVFQAHYFRRIFASPLREKM